ncbi:MAG TPA: N-acetylmuramoyl-L-alanine amidase-like domain-containing protein [Phycisphaerae bacterium]|nr:N-acetylmuramoyl-L-alanine amidase-like domain-containing protein [Phycisphaerae bacterium]
MRRLLPFVLLALVGPACGVQQGAVRDLAVLREARLYTFNEREADAYLRWLSKQPIATVDRAVALGRKNLGQPYRLGLLGEYPFELYDPEPLFCLSASDCVTFVEHSYAMAMSHDWASFIRVLQRIRYKDGRISILMRNHFMEADWNINNDWLFDDMTTSLSGGDPQPMEVAVDRAALFRKYGIVADVPIEIVDDAYIPRDRLPDVAAQLEDGDIIEFVRGDERSRHVSHVGLIAHDAANQATLLHSGAPAVQEVPLEAYLRRHSDVIGFKILRMVEGELEPGEEERHRDEQIVRGSVPDTAKLPGK